MLSLVKNKKRCLLVLRTVGFILGTACAALFIVGLFYRIIPQLIVLSAMFYIGAATEVKKEMYRVRFLDCYFVKDGGPTEEKTLYVPPEMKINKLLSSLSGRYVYIIVVTHGEKEIARLSGRAIEDLFLGDRDMSIGRYLSQNNLVGV